jgi:hypothetical protein
MLPPRTPPLDIPGADVPPAGAQVAAAQSAASQGGFMNTLFPEGARYATPDEEGQVMEHRWPH